MQTKAHLKKEHNKIIHGVSFYPDWHDLQCLLWLFRLAPQLQSDPLWRPSGAIPAEEAYDGAGRFVHLREIALVIYGARFEWHSWAEQILAKACESKMMCVSGPGASGKSTDMALYGLTFWQSAPLDTAVLIASKTIDSAKKRIWREVSRLYAIFNNAVGGYRNATIGTSPRPSISPFIPGLGKKDEAHGLYVTALHGKELDKEIEYIKGFHPKRILVMPDELDSLEEGGRALVDTYINNLATGAMEAQFIGLGNDPSLLNALGDLMSPEQGQPVTLAHTTWKSAKDVDCIRLDAWDSPNIREDNKYQGLVSQKDIDRIVKAFGENSPAVWIQLHGLHPPEGSEQTVMSEATFLRFNAFKDVNWRSTYIASAALDPAFGGDPCCLRFFKRGEDTDGKLRIACSDIIMIPIVADDKYNDPEHQIAHRVIAECAKHQVPPHEFCIGSTGIGRGAASALKREWSTRIIEVEEGGAPSDYIINPEDPRPANELYDRKVTELHFSVRTFVEADMFRNVDIVTARQCCNRLYEYKGNKISIESKVDMKARGLKSPNEADALCFYVHLLVQKQVTPLIKSKVRKNEDKELQKFLHQCDYDRDDLAYSSDD